MFGQYGDMDIGSNEIIVITKEKRTRENFPGFTIYGNGKATRYGGKSMDILDVCEKLNRAEMNLMKMFRDQVEVNKMNDEKNYNLVVPNKIAEWSNYYKVALKKNYPHMECLGVIRRVKRGTYMLNPYLFIPKNRLEYHRTVWEDLDRTCSDETVGTNKDQSNGST